MQTRREQARDYAPRITAFLQDIVRIPSLSGKEQDVVTRIAQEMSSLNIYDSVRTDALGNAIGTWGYGPCVILLDGHCDVVDTGDQAAWTYPPYGAEIHNDILYGRGAVDEKPAIACMTYAPCLLDPALKEHVTVVVVTSVLEEDCDGYPLDHIIRHEGITPAFVILGEPTDMNVFRGQRGRMEMTVSVTGTPAHGAHCDRGDNAIYKMAHIIHEIEQLHTRLPSDPLLGKGSVTISRIDSRSPSLCSVADACTIYLDRRLTRGETRESACAELYALPSVQRYGAHVQLNTYVGTSWTGMSVRKDAYFPTWVLDDTHHLVKTVKEAAENVLEKDVALGVWTFSTNGVSTMGEHAIPTVGFAPGREELAHAIDEHICVTPLSDATAVYAESITTLATTAQNRAAS